MNLSKLFFVCIPCPLPNKTKLSFDKYFKAYWSFCFELNVLYSSTQCLGSVVPLAMFYSGCELAGFWKLLCSERICFASQVGSAFEILQKKERRKTKRNLITQVEAISTTAAWNLIYKYFCNNCSPSILAGPIWSNIFGAWICHSFALAMIELGGLMKVWRITGDQGVDDCTCLAMWGLVGAPMINRSAMCAICNV